MLRKYCLFFLLALTFTSRIEAQTELDFEIIPGDILGSSVIQIALRSHQGKLDILKAWVASEPPSLMEVSDNLDELRKEVTMIPISPPDVYLYADVVSINRSFRTEAVLPDNSRWKVRIELAGVILESNTETIIRSKESLTNAAVVAIRIGDFERLQEIGTTLIDRQPDQTHGYRYRGIARLMQGKFSAAKEDIQVARSIFYKANPPVDSTGRMVPNWEPPHILDKVLRQIRMNESGKSIDQE